jgi:hypothetical protein
VAHAQQHYTLQPMMRMDGSIFVDAQTQPPQSPQLPVPQTKTVESNVPPIIQSAPKRIILGLSLPDTTLVCREEARTTTCQTIEELFAKKGK